MTAPDDLRLIRRLEQLATIGADPAGGVSRLSFTADDIAGRELVAGWMGEAGLDVTVDAATNLVGRRAGADPDHPHLVVGSHLDSVRQGGALDGAYGVVAAVEVADRLRGHPLHHGLTVVAFANEEGTTAPPFTGSRTLIAEKIPLDDPLDGTGRTLRTTLATAGGRPDDLAGAAFAPGSVAAMVELHIEQGPVLEARAIRIGVVQAITGRQLLDITFTGRANHAGTTPMDLRHDALVVAARLVLEADRLARTGLVRVMTVGLLDIAPNVRNVIPGRALVGVDIRDADDDLVQNAAAQVSEIAHALGAAAGIDVSIAPDPPEHAVATDPRLQDAIEAVATRRGLSTMRMPSGAGHDAQIIAEVAPVGMIFVPSVAGVSHSPREATLPEDLIAGMDVLHDTLIEIDQTLLGGAR